MIEHFRNFGAMTTAREFWGGNNGFVTIALNLAATQSLPVGADYLAAKAAHEAGTATEAQLVRMVNAERNLFNLAQALGQRAVVVAVSEVEDSVTDASIALTVGGNVLAASSAGTPADNAYAVTFLIERADVLTAQTGKPGATYAVDVNPCQEVADNLAGAVVFSHNNTQYEPNGAVASGTAPTTAAGVKVKVWDALPVLK